jgi:hypothetical protein
MAAIDRETMQQIRLKAKEYMKFMKGRTITKEDIMIAENLIIFGYMKAKNEADRSLERGEN